MKVYLAGPVAGHSDETQFVWRNEARMAIGERRCRDGSYIQVIDPTEGMRRFGPWESTTRRPLPTPEHPNFVFQKSMGHVRAADVVIARVFENIHSTGTDMEVALAIHLHKPLIVWVATPKSRVHPFYEANAILIACDVATVANLLERL